MSLIGRLIAASALVAAALPAVAQRPPPGWQEQSYPHQMAGGYTASNPRIQIDGPEGGCVLTTDFVRSHTDQTGTFRHVYQRATRVPEGILCSDLVRTGSGWKDSQRICRDRLCDLLVIGERYYTRTNPP